MYCVLGCKCLVSTIEIEWLVANDAQALPLCVEYFGRNFCGVVVYVCCVSNLSGRVRDMVWKLWYSHGREILFLMMDYTLVADGGGVFNI